MHNSSSGLRVTLIFTGLVAIGAAIGFGTFAGGREPASHARPPIDRDDIRGVNYAHIHQRGHGYGSEVSKRQLHKLKQLGANWIALTGFGYQRSSTADHIVGFPVEDRGKNARAHRGSLNEQAIVDEANAAHADGLQVLLKPHIWSWDFWNSKQWHGTVRQKTDAARKRWWASYRQFALYWAHLAKRTGAEGFCIGTELVLQTKPQQTQRWRALIEDIREVYDGPLTYAAHWQKELEQIGFWDDLDAIGVNAYYPLDAPKQPSVEQLVKAWQPWKAQIASVQREVHKPVVFTEIGYRPVTQTHVKPWQSHGGDRSGQAQARAYQAMFRAFADEPWFDGLFLWKAFTDPSKSGHHGEGSTFNFVGTAAQPVIERWFGRP